MSTVFLSFLSVLNKQYWKDMVIENILIYLLSIQGVPLATGHRDYNVKYLHS